MFACKDFAKGMCFRDKCKRLHDIPQSVPRGLTCFGETNERFDRQERSVLVTVESRNDETRPERDQLDGLQGT